ncbi:response regulator transcription factor [Mycolicibacterium litorale]|nr:response regulator transcription factor [Mycolicibacterium litorale]MCV7416653.1 response regulator transcription factor [Mycolicibacterium litorale]TDY09906.1 response regulator receiver domain-containing protein [Mycolicibacterium litorale]
MRCLIVDDSAEFRDAARAMLTRAGIDVVAVAANIADALRYSRELEPDVALVDVDLGGENGFDLAEQLDRSGLPTAPAVILVSTYAEQDLAEMLAVSPAIGFVSKISLSATAIRNLLGADRGPVSEPRGR